MDAAKFATFIVLALAVAIRKEFVSGIDKTKRIAKRDYRHPAADVYTASWAVEIVEGGKEMADIIASRYGFINRGSLSEVRITGSLCCNVLLSAIMYARSVD